VMRAIRPIRVPLLLQALDDQASEAY
jgi:hypothetical protein